MKVRMLVDTAGPDVHYAAGQIVDVDDEVGEAWLASGQAARAPGRPKKRKGTPGGERHVAPPGGETHAG